MFVKFKKTVQKKLITKAIAKAGSERKLSHFIGLSKGTLYRYKTESNNISGKNLVLVLNFLKEKYSDYDSQVAEVLPKNWGQIKGGKNCIQTKKANGTFSTTIEKLKKVTHERLKTWHREMRENSPREYYQWQYERFKKVGGGYKCALKNGINVRNNFEKKVGDYLLKLNLSFEYEPYLLIGKKAYFPDFRIKELIIEVTEWKHPSGEKLKYLRKKIDDYEKAGYQVVFFIPESLRKLYKGIDDYIISDFTHLRKLCPCSLDVKSTEQ